MIIMFGENQKLSNFLIFIILSFPVICLSDTKNQFNTDFSRIKEVLKNDQLEKEVQKKIALQKQTRNIKELAIKGLYNIPKENEIWSFLTEFWIVKNIDRLKWNFEKPDYGLDEFFSKFLQDLGYYEVSFKILLLDNSLVPHFCLPSNSNEAIFLLSAPFIRILDLSKKEISLLLLEGFIRGKMNQFKNKVNSPELVNIMDTNFQKKDFPQKVFDNIFKKYDEVIFEKGFNFEEQFEVTMKMEGILKTNLDLWKSYLNLIEKIGNLAKTNILYKDYAKLYPSPEMQINWLMPKKKQL